MSEPVQLESNVLFFPRAELTTGKGLKLVVKKGAAVCTQKFVFMIPSQDVRVGMLSARLDAAANPEAITDAARALIERHGQTVRDLERELATSLGPQADDRVFEISRLKSFKVSGFGPLLQLRMKLPDSVAPCVLVARGKGAMKQLKAFYAPRPG